MQRVILRVPFQFIQDGRLSMKVDGVPPTTRSLKEHLVAKSIEMEASTNANITALITM